jgi:signal transduction histidine kinase
MQARLPEQTDSKVVLEYGKRDGVAYLAVEDNGCGMDEDTVNNLYQPFFTKGKVSGTGLGMAIVKNIVVVHGADIQVKSILGKGTRFEISFSNPGGK